jgi:putative ABC transport system permease protein
MLEKIEAVPEVKKVAVATGVPGRGPGFGTRFTIVGQPVVDPANPPGAALQMVTPGFVDALGIRVIKGRAFDEHDTSTSTRVAMVNERLVQRYFAGADPITQRIAFQDPTPGAPPGKPIEFQIVGVFHNVRGGNDREEYAEINIPFWQSPSAQASIVAQTQSDPKAAIQSIAAAVNSVDADMPLAGVRTVDEVVSETLAIDQFAVVLFGCFGVLGLLLAAVGIYSVMAFAVAQRTQEFGVRMALGAERARIIRMILKEGSALAFIGSLIGLGAAYLVGRLMQSTLFGVAAWDVGAFSAVLFVLLVSALIACLVPAWRASRVEPVEALRSE